MSQRESCPKAIWHCKILSHADKLFLEGMQHRKNHTRVGSTNAAMVRKDTQVGENIILVALPPYASKYIHNVHVYTSVYIYMYVLIAAFVFAFIDLHERAHMIRGL